MLFYYVLLHRVKYASQFDSKQKHGERDLIQKKKKKAHTERESARRKGKKKTNNTFEWQCYFEFREKR